MSQHSSHGQDGASSTFPFGVRPAAPDTPITVRSVAASKTITGSIVRSLGEQVGGIDALERLDADPFPDEQFQWTEIDGEHAAVVSQILAAMDEALGAGCPPVEEFGLDCFTLEGLRRDRQARIDDEYRTIARRLLARIARTKPVELTRSGSGETAAALVWLALMGNFEFGRQRLLKADDIWYLFGVQSCSRRGRALYRSLAFPESASYHCEQRGAVPLHDAALIHSARRSELLCRRDRLLADFAVERRRSRDSRPIQSLPNGQIQIAAKQVIPRWALRFNDDNGRSRVMVTFGEHEDKPEVLALTVPDARHLISMLENALAKPFLRAN